MRREGIWYGMEMKTFQIIFAHDESTAPVAKGKRTSVAKVKIQYIYVTLFKIGINYMLRLESKDL
jgi:hypothetical protein